MKSEKDPFFIVYDRFINELKLYGMEILVYSLIYSFCTQGYGCFNGSIKYIANRVGASESGTVKVLKKLTEKGLIIKEDPVRKGIDSARYSLPEYNTPLSSVTEGNRLSERAAVQSNSNNKEIENSHNAVIDMTKSDLLEITSPEERKCLVKEFAYIFSKEDMDQNGTIYLCVTDLLCEMVSQPAATYNGKTVSADDVWKKLVMNLQDDYQGWSIRDFIWDVIWRIDELKAKNIRNLYEYSKALIWNKLQNRGLTEHENERSCP